MKKLNIIDNVETAGCDPKWQVGRLLSLLRETWERQLFISQQFSQLLKYHLMSISCVKDKCCPFFSLSTLPNPHLPQCHRRDPPHYHHHHFPLPTASLGPRAGKNSTGEKRKYQQKIKSSFPTCLNLNQGLHQQGHSCKIGNTPNKVEKKSKL